ncbi:MULTISPECIES: hypothetical protein [unclassified Neptuniibacter]|uniref:hypothetical protein n=1 Tax=unclassified Neptuniibacter TaxID=2630693 RepID=UPI000C626902|nr:MULTISPECIES: hypothetical protein [unclassified Neptuniibacter]MAY43575.1 hypothetical protein [Oceanospirillaceae bacterium]
MFLKGASLPFILLIGSTVLLSACSQKDQLICGLSNPDCEVPSPPREHTRVTTQKETAIGMASSSTKADSTPSMTSTQVQSSKAVTVKHADTVVPSQPSPQQPSNSAKQLTKVQVIEHIRKPTTVVRTKVIYKPPVAQTTNKVQSSVTVSSLTSNAVYTIQLGAYKKISSRKHAIKQFPDDSELLLFTMRNDLLGLSYGQYETLSEAKAKRSWLLEQGITDFVFRHLPRNAQPLN